MKKRLVLLLAFMCFMLFALIPRSYATEKITKEELGSLLGKSGVVVLDVRTTGDWNSSRLKIKGAEHQDPHAVDSWAKKYSWDDKIVLYCA